MIFVVHPALCDVHLSESIDFSSDKWIVKPILFTSLSLIERANINIREEKLNEDFTRAEKAGEMKIVTDSDLRSNISAGAQHVLFLQKKISKQQSAIGS